MDSETLVLFAMNASRDFGARVAEKLGVSLGEHQEQEFEDGEHKSRPLVNVRNKDVFVIQSLYSDPGQSVNDKLCRLLFFLGALRDASARTVTAVIPYLAYARKDKKSKSRDPVTTRYVATLFEAIGIDRILTLDVHNLAAFQNAFRCCSDHLEATPLFVDYFASRLQKEAKIAVVAPDAGGIKRAESFRTRLAQRLNKDISLAFMEKARSMGVLTAGRIFGDVMGCYVVIIDDMISTGGTLYHAARICKADGAKTVVAAATHGLFVSGANQVLAGTDLDKIIVTDTIPPFRLEGQLLRDKLVVLSVAGLFAEAIKRIHTGGSLTELMESRVS